MSLSMLDPRVLLSLLVGLIAYSAVGGYLVYARGRDDMKNAYTAQQLQAANANLANSQKQQDRAASAGADHEQGIKVVHDTTREIVRTVTIPAAADPYLPVGFVRLFDRSASRSVYADPYPGKSDGDPSDVRVSEAATLLTRGWADAFYACRKQVEDTVALKPVLPSPPPPRSFLDRLNPF